MRLHLSMLASLITLGMIAQAHAVEWSGAPVACLPDRAQRWGGDHGVMQPCHCPPEEQYCPDEETDLTLDDIELHITIDGIANDEQGNPVSYVIKAEETDAENPRSLFAMTRDEMLALVRPKIIEISGLDIYGLPLCNNNTHGGWCTVSITILITDIPNGFRDWLNDVLKLPVLLASRCCDSICPAGFTPTLTKVTILKPRDPNEGIHMPRPDIEAMVDELNELRADLQAKGGLNAQVSATLSLRTSVQTYLAAPIPGDDATLEALLDDLGDFNTLIKAAAVPSSIKNDNADVIGKATALADQTAQELAIRNTPPQMIEVDALQCSVVITLPREGCLIAGTQITLADGTKKAIEELTLDDKLKGNHGAAKIIALNKFTQRNEEMYSINGGQAFFTIEHPVLTPGGWKSVDSKVTSIKSDAKMIGTLAVGDVILMEGGKQLKVESIEKLKVESGKSAYNISVEGDGSFIANGFIMKGFKQLQMHY